MATIAVLEGYTLPDFSGYSKARSNKMAKRRRGGKAAQKAKFKSAAKHCKGKSLKAFRSCMRSRLKK